MSRAKVCPVTYVVKSAVGRLVKGPVKSSVKNPVQSFAILFATFTAFSVQAAPTYVASVIEPRQEIQTSMLADLNGDGRQDLLLAVWSDQGDRELLIYLQDENGQFPGQPFQRVEVKKDIIAFGVGDVRDEAGEELLFITHNAVYSYSTRKDGYSENLQKLVDCDFLNTVPHGKSLDSIGRLADYNGDGHADLLLPGRESYGLFYGSAEGFSAAKTLPAPHTDPEFRSAQDSRVRLSLENGLRLEVDTPSAFDGLFPEREPRDDRAARRSLGRFGTNDYIMDVQAWLASVQPARITGSEAADFVFLDHAVSDNLEGQSEGQSEGKAERKAARRFNVVAQKAVAERAWEGMITSSGEIFVSDFDADGKDDVMILEHQGSKDSRLLLFRNRNGKFDFSSADQVLRFSGYEVEVLVRDLNNDGRPELIVSYYSLGTVDSLRSGAMQRTTMIYPPADDDLVFARRPSTRADERFSADGVRGLAERPHFSADVSGNGRRDWLAVDEQGALIAKAIDDKLQLAAEPFWRFVPTYLIQSIVPGQFNDDNRSDFLLQHQNAITLLVSRHD